MKWWDQMPWSWFSEHGVLSQLFHSPLSLSLRGSLVLAFCHKGGVICISVIDISPSNQLIFHVMKTKISLLTPKKDVLFIIGNWNAKVGSQEKPGVTGKFGLGVQNEVGQRLTEFCQDLFQQHKRRSTHGHHQIVNTKIRLIIFFGAKDGEALYNQQKQDWPLTVALIMNSLLPNSDLNWRK